MFDVPETARPSFTAETAPSFDGETYEEEVDHERLGAQFLRVFAVVRDGHWRSLKAISLACGDPEASVSARLRDMRKKKFGGHNVERERVDDDRGLFVYRVLVNVKTIQPNET
jgi:hypothetical protein